MAAAGQVEEGLSVCQDRATVPVKDRGVLGAAGPARGDCASMRSGRLISILFKNPNKVAVTYLTYTAYLGRSSSSVAL